MKETMMMRTLSKKKTRKFCVISEQPNINVKKETNMYSEINFLTNQNVRFASKTKKKKQGDSNEIKTK